MPTEFIWYLDKFNQFGWMFLLLLLEVLFPIRKGPVVSRGWISDLIFMHEPFVRAFIVGGAVVALIPVMAHVPGAGLMASQPMWVNVIGVMVLNEFTVYWGHRLLHRVPWLWEFHRVHHSSTRYYSLMTTRFHVVDVLVSLGPFALLSAWLGARPEALIGYSLFLGWMDRYVHSNVRGPRFTGYIINTPYFHAWHHATDPEAYDKNFSRVFVFMDYLFGTAYYPKHKTPEEFGDPEFPKNYFVAQIYPFVVVGHKFMALFRRRVRAATPVRVEAEHTADPAAHA